MPKQSRVGQKSVWWVAASGRHRAGAQWPSGRHCAWPSALL